MKNPSFSRNRLISPLWVDSANSISALTAARHAQLHRRAFPWLVLLFGIAFARLIIWFNPLP